MYPPGTTTRADVQKRWNNSEPNEFEVRPAGGWDSSPHREMAAHVAGIEKRNGKTVSRWERRMGADGWFSLSNCWYYYDEQDRVVDVEWEYQSD